jgi:hypothetical protein
LIFFTSNSGVSTTINFSKIKYVYISLTIFLKNFYLYKRINIDFIIFINLIFIFNLFKKMEQKDLILTSLRSNQFELLFKQLETGELPDTIDYLSNIEHGDFWKCINKYTNKLITSLHLDDVDDDDVEDNEKIIVVEQLSQSISFLKQIIQIIPLYFNIKHRSEYLLQTIEDLHDILIPLNDELFGAVSLKTSISRICEHWWIKEENGAENLITQLIPFYLLTSLGPKSVDADIKRVFNIRGSFMLLDFDDPSIESIRNLLLRCFINPSYLKLSEGRRFLAYLFSVNQGLHSLFVSVMKPQLGAGIKGISTSYGDMLFRAFKECKSISITSNNSGPTDKEIEISDIMQGIVHEAIHACESKYFKSLRIVLSVFSNQKNVKGVDSFLLLVYGPILWRSLRCANALVRVQATILFFDTFPLHDPDSSAQDGDILLQKQFDLLTSLLKDSDHRVRSSAASGVCHILRDFWSSVPFSTTKQILSYVVGTLGSDASCSNVRLAVVSGLGELLEQPLSHSVLKNLLPLLTNTIHDSAEKVRIGFIEILCKVKSIRGMHFYNIIPVDQLIQRLHEDYNKPSITSVMTKLLLHSYYPQGDKSVAPMGPEQTRRCIKFVRHNSIAAEAFYSNLLQYTSVGSVSKLSIMIFTLFIDDFSGYNLLEEDIEDVGALGVGIEDKKDIEDNGGKRRRNTNESNNNFLSDSTLLSGMMNVLLACFYSISDKVTHENHLASNEILRSFFTTESILKVFLSLIEKEKNNENLTIIPTYLKLIALVNKSLVTLESGDEDEEESDNLLKTLVFESYQSTFLSQDDNAQLEHAIATVEIFFAKGQMVIIVSFISIIFSCKSNNFYCSGYSISSNLLCFSIRV